MAKYIAHCSSDWYQYDRIVHVDKRLDRMPSAQAGIKWIDGGCMLISYETIVCEIVDDWLHCYGIFSQTTRKHIGAFLREVAPGMSYYDAKMCYEDDVEINVKTREMRDAAQGMIQTVGIKVG